MDSTTAVIDADSIVWATAYLNYEKTDDFRPGLDFFLQEMLLTVKATEYVGFLGSSAPLHRNKIISTYKANRPPKPDFYLALAPAIREHLLDRWGFQEAPEGYEADDAMASAAAKFRREGKTHVLCGIDKDLKQIKGTHYNFNKKTSVVVEWSEAQYVLATQLLMGDSTDNIGGVPGVGAVRAKKFLEAMPTTTYKGFMEAVLKVFQEKFGEALGLKRFCETYLLVWLDDSLEFELKINKVER